MDERWNEGSGRACVLGLMVVASLGLGCATMPMMDACPRGQQRFDGQCVPTSSLVFERCLESFRKTREQRNHGVDTELSARVEGQGGSLKHERKDHEEAEYGGVSEALMSDAIEECRRQEQQQRSMELERAWAAAEDAQARAIEADDRAHAAERAQQRAQDDARRYEQETVVLREQLETARTELAQVQLQQEDMRSLMVERHPCTAQAWDRCGEQALAAKRDGEYGRAHSMYRDACEGGSADACGNWGVMFEHGLGIPVDLVEARRLYEVGCEGDSANACVNLGFLHEQGRGAARELDRAAALYETACEQGQMRGCGRLGKLLAGGAVDGELYPSAGELLTRACDGDFPRACLWAGVREVEGRDGERHPGRAARRFARACEHDVPEACVQLGRLHELGDGVPEDPAGAGALYRRACEAGDPRGCAAAERLSRGGEQDHNTEWSAP